MQKKISKDEVNALPLHAYDGEVEIINTPEGYKKAVAEIQDFPLIGFDTESKPSFTKGIKNPIALVQLATDDKVYLFRLPKGDVPKELRKILEDENIEKIGIGIDDDLNDLRRIGVAKPKEFLDLNKLAKKAGFHNTGARNLSAMLLGFRISKSAQTSNWEREELTEKQISYAATDAWICLKIYEKLYQYDFSDVNK
ncbi:3'-5' exonuclease domain-containing protein 2 [Mangrovivirga sp. M17]|uniref:3'-5' exonuclease domain-containing protein 2 n=1 Tax=Mangrovivirga halotolerans TaxID=2993936 RepID=A0ABT3RMQ6_9BACT|nr:3'-5' exonuclease [Mangrovivirga halotolerans]MCX2742860.1 3'-5' exonuclease domain-containing protein 2 [Mangrovivirga halotolerans]